MRQEEMFEVFGGFDPSEHEDEVKERWGETDAYSESTRRTARYTKADWEAFKGESMAIAGAIAALMDEGVAPNDPRAMDAVESARLLIEPVVLPLLARDVRRTRADVTSPTCVSRRRTRRSAPGWRSTCATRPRQTRAAASVTSSAMV